LGRKRGSQAGGDGYSAGTSKARRVTPPVGGDVEVGALYSGLYSGLTKNQQRKKLPLWAVAKKGDEAAVRALLAAGAAVDEVTAGRTALHFAARAGQGGAG